MRRCISCGTENDEGRHTCWSCGRPLGAGASSSASETAARAPDRDGRPVDPHEILRLLRDGRKIPAIKLYRERTGLGLKESKEAVEALARQQGIKTSPSGCGPLGCLVVVVLVAVAVGLAVTVLQSSGSVG